MSDALLPYDHRRKVFSSIVGARAAGATPTEYRKVIAERFGLTVRQLATIETEGDANGWAPKPFTRPAGDEEEPAARPGPSQKPDDPGR
jgi:hypothetical protein